MKTLQIVLLISLGVIFASGGTIREHEEEKRLVKTSEESPGTWLTEEEIFGLIRNGQTFIDITDFDYSNVDKTKKTKAGPIPTAVQYQATVNGLIELIDSGRLVDFVRDFSRYHNRFYAGTTGRESQRWLFAQVQDSVSDYAGRATVREVDHGFLQRSIVARLQGQSLASEVVILGAHLDSINIGGPSLSAPGADDNASGSVVLLETLRAIVESGLLLQRTVEFQWYAAEEVGLRGSQAIASDYNDSRVDVMGMLNFDVVGYHDGINSIGIYEDNGHPELIQLLELLTDEYLDYEWRNNTCGYACSDHASWTLAGFPAVMASEFVPHPMMHTTQDTIHNMNFTQVNEFIKLAMGYVVEMAEPEPEIPTTTPEVPTTTPEVPTTTEDVPTTTPEIPTTTEEIPTTTEEIPTTTPDIPTTTEDIPTTTPEIPSTTEAP